MEKNSITKLFEDVSLYEDKVFNLYTFSDDCVKVEVDVLKEITDYLGLTGNKNLITDCILCNGRFPFRVKYSFKDYDGNLEGLYLGKIQFGGRREDFFYDFNRNFNIESIPIENDSLKASILFIDYFFYCTNTKEHQYRMNVVLINDKKNLIVRKIGQFPEKTLIGEYVADEYKTTLRKINDSYIDYKHGEKSYKFGLYIGAYDYLRRVYEKTINYYLVKKGFQVDSMVKTEEKIKSIKDCFDEKIRDLLYPLYSALSAGVHVMSEDECKEHYNELKIIIDIQLQYIKSNDEINEKIDKSSKVLREIQNKYSKK